VTRAPSEKAHWERVYEGRAPTEVSWYQETAATSLRLIEATGLGTDASVIDVGGGASRLVDGLLDRGYTRVSVLDISRAALDRTASRLGARADAVTLIEASFADIPGEATYDVWHDRAMLHFLVEPVDRRAYVASLRAKLRPGGAAIIGTFAPDGPEQCSGLPVRRYDPTSLGELLGEGFHLVETVEEAHATPAGVVQEFQFCRFERRSPETEARLTRGADPTIASMSPAAQLERLARIPNVPTFDEALAAEGLPPLRPARVEVMQINVGKLCNQTCAHCHVAAGPDRTEVMDRRTMEQCLDVLARTDIPTVDITGGAPEMNPSFRWLLDQIAVLGRRIIHRTNLTILDTPSHRDLPELFARLGVELLASLPHYSAAHTELQRGDGVFRKSIRVLSRLNELGYGTGERRRWLVLVTNPVGPFLPPDQTALEAEWKRELAARWDVRFDALYCMNNMPISRYLEWLDATGKLDGYVQKLVRRFNPEAAAHTMCRTTLSVGWDGRLYDCDFQQMLDRVSDGPAHISEFDASAFEARTIRTDRHCFGCTAGAGSSCDGAIT
jgi:radical SAM/Cys-rich protein